MNRSTLEPYSATTPLHDCEWKGQRSSKFPPTIRHLPAKDLIRTNFELPDQTPRRGRGHFYEPTSFQKPFRSSMHRVPPIQHRHLRQSSIRTIDFKPSPRAPRAEQRHHIDIRNPESLSPQSLRTFYFANSRTEREYGVEERMQRKGRIDQVQLRRSFYKDLSIFKR